MLGFEVRPFDRHTLPAPMEWGRFEEGNREMSEKRMIESSGVRSGAGRAAAGRVVAGRRSGFTLIEVLIVIAIVVALSGLVGIALFSKQKEAKVGLAKTDLKTIESALKQFRVKFDRYPTDEEGVEVLWNKEKLDADADATKWTKELEKPMKADQWGTPWNYRQKSDHGDEDSFDLWSFGPDKQEGGDDDIVSWTESDSESSSGGGAGSTGSGTKTGGS